MGEYCAVRDVRLALTPSADHTDSSTAASLPDWQIEDAISEAEGMVNAYVLARYTVPSVEVEENPPEDNPDAGILVFIVAPSPIRGWTRDIAAYLATLTFRQHKDLPEDDPVRLRYQMVLDMLTAVRDGKTDLPVVFPPAGDEAGDGVHVVNLYDGTLFGPEDFGLGPEGQTRQTYWPVYPNV